MFPTKEPNRFPNRFWLHTIDINRSTIRRVSRNASKQVFMQGNRHVSRHTNGQIPRGIPRHNNREKWACMRGRGVAGTTGTWRRFKVRMKVAKKLEKLLGTKRERTSNVNRRRDNYILPVTTREKAVF